AMIKRIVNFFVSLRLTVTLLAFAIVLVFVGTLAQVDEGLYQAQSHYFRQWFIVGMHLVGKNIPIVFPGGYLIGTLLLVNLVAAHIYRFEFTRKKIGIYLAHLGVILLLVGQLATDMLAREMQMHFDEGQTRSYAESATQYELIFQNGDEVTSIPANLLKAGDELKIDSLPFAIRVKAFWKNSDLNFRAPMMTNAPALTTNGIARSFDFREVAETKTMDERNVPSAIIELLPQNNSTGDWVVSGWASDDSLVEAIRNSYASQIGFQMAQDIASKLAAPQIIEVGEKKFTFALRPVRYYEPFSLTLLKATHTVYPGTDIPKDFRSRVLLQNPKTGEHREVEISMNHPLRYNGLTFYQYQMDAGQVAQQAGRTPSSVLTAVRNPGWLTPYIGCAMVGTGLLIQFLMHLTKFVSRQKKK
ncbi:MAG TPA: cytochrome c biogenesis protein ResB, partial [Pyrinomonadaceae bacterium]|nr:cytochrome c biogenesis protein ResB [Pyrinomonadaceae bacterium]